MAVYTPVHKLLKHLLIKLQPLGFFFRKDFISRPHLDSVFSANSFSLMCSEPVRLTASPQLFYQIQICT